MGTVSREEVRDHLLRIISEVREGWEQSSQMTEDTGIFRELQFESIDAVALGACLEEHFGQPFPFAEFLTRAKEQNLPDITIGQLVSLLMSCLNGATGGVQP
jgi:acyl carrier protein